MDDRIINQKSVFGDNVITIVTGYSDRVMSDELQQRLTKTLSDMKIKSVAIHYEYNGETVGFVNKLTSFIESQHYLIAGMTQHTQSGYQRNQITIEKTQDPSVAIIRVGTR